MFHFFIFLPFARSPLICQSREPPISYRCLLRLVVKSSYIWDICYHDPFLKYQEFLHRNICLKTRAKAGSLSSSLHTVTLVVFENSLKLSDQKLLPEESHNHGHDLWQYENFNGFVLFILFYIFRLLTRHVWATPPFKILALPKMQGSDQR